MFKGRALAVSEDVMFKWRLLVENGRRAGLPIRNLTASSLRRRCITASRSSRTTLAISKQPACRFSIRGERWGEPCKERQLWNSAPHITPSGKCPPLSAQLCTLPYSGARAAIAEGDRLRSQRDRLAPPFSWLPSLRATRAFECVESHRRSRQRGAERR